jgi:DNA-binding winged helix-turn-helix (wHTH) protein
LHYLFADHVLDTDRRELRRGGTSLPVEPLVFDLLAYLIRNRERVVTKEDLREAIWGGRIVSESTLSSCITSVRAAVGDNGEDQHLIRTLPRKGFRFVAPVREERELAAPTAAPDISVYEPAPVARFELTRDRADRLTPADARHRSKPARRAAVVAAGLGTVAVLLVVFWLGSDALRRPSRPMQKFDAATIPLVSDETREFLTSYPKRPDAKALALAPDGIGVADGASSRESATQEALRQCGIVAKRVCRAYAVGMDVVWSAETFPLPAPIDLHIEPLNIPIVADEMPMLSADIRQAIAERYLPLPDHKAAAVASGALWLVTRRRSRDEAVRMAVEICSAISLRPCLVLSVDGFLTVQIPKTRKVVGTFLPSTEPGIPVADRARIAQVYQGREWRALASGKNGTWHPVAAAPSEAAAVAAASEACARTDRECRIYAIGNFRVTDE